MKQKMKWKQSYIFPVSIFFITMFVVCCPLMTGNCINGHDISYHLLRVEALKEGILIGKPFLKINVLYFGGAGYGSSLFYPDFLLYIPALFRAAGIGINLSFHLFVALCFAAGYFTAYQCMKLITGSIYSATITAVVVTMCQYHIDDVYTRSAVGEYTALIFLPLVLYGIYDLMYEQLKRPWIMGVGFAGILLCHTNTTVFCMGLYFLIVLINSKKFIKNPRLFLRLCITAIVVALGTAFYWMPVLEQMMSAKFSYGKASFDLGYEMLEVKNIFANQNPGMGIIIFLLCLPRLFLRKISGEEQPEEKTGRSICLRFADWMLVFGLLFTLGATRMVPWAKLNQIFSFIQFPWRFFIMSSCLLAFAIGIYWEYYLQEEKLREYGFLLVLALMTASCLSNIERNDQGYYSYSEDYYSYKPFTGEVIGGEWLPATVLDRQKLMDDSDKAKDDTGKQDTVTRDKNTLIARTDGKTAYLDVPFVYYKGYEAKLLKTGEKLAVTGDGENGVCRVLLPQGEEGEILVYYAGTVIQVISAIVSGLILAGIIFFVVKKKKLRSM